MGKILLHVRRAIGGMALRFGQWMMGEEQQADEAGKETDIADENIYFLMELLDDKMLMRGFIGSRDQCAQYTSKLAGKVVSMHTLAELRRDLIANATQFMERDEKWGWLH